MNGISEMCYCLLQLENNRTKQEYNHLFLIKKKRAKQNRAVVQPRVPKISNIKSSLIIFSIEQNKMFSIYSISGCKISNVRYQYLRGSQ